MEDFTPMEGTTIKTEREIVLELNQKLLDAIMKWDYETYDRLCSDDMTCIEPETNCQVVIGKEFHKHYFDHAAATTTAAQSSNNINIDQSDTTMVPVVNNNNNKNVTMCQPHVRFLGNDETIAIITYARINQTFDSNGGHVTTMAGETRVWEKRDGNWIHCHFHKN